MASVLGVVVALVAAASHEFGVLVGVGRTEVRCPDLLVDDLGCFACVPCAAHLGSRKGCLEVFGSWWVFARLRGGRVDVGVVV